MMSDLLTIICVVEFFLFLYLVTMALRIYSTEYKARREWRKDGRRD